MKRFGISDKNTLGIPIPVLRSIAKREGRDHDLAVRLWKSGVHEARILATMVEDPENVTSKQMDEWTNDFDSWDVCDQCCGNLFGDTKYAYSKVYEWSRSDREFVKRAGYAMICAITVHDKDAGDRKFTGFFPVIRKGATDERNFVRKAVNWALRQIGKRNRALNAMAIKEAEAIAKMDSKSARWIAADALRELKSESVKRRISNRALPRKLKKQ
jgi:3-methyladenine DNA glycosylase AlkD